MSSDDTTTAICSLYALNVARMVQHSAVIQENIFPTFEPALPSLPH
ncbi:hypothetical protein AVEN_200414-1, partial [Araneus ventricosus]